jgi:putative hemin transport protein
MQAPTVSEQSTLELAVRWSELRLKQPMIRIRDAADTLGVSEAELLATRRGARVVLLDLDPAALLHALPALGPALAVTRNDGAISEQRGRYGGIELDDRGGDVIGRVSGRAIDLRLFLSHWHLIFAVTEEHAAASDGLRRSLQVFDRAGSAVHKVYLEPGADLGSFETLVGRFADRRPDSLLRPLPVAPYPPSPLPRPDAAIGRGERDRLCLAWDALRESHEFTSLLRRFDVTRTQALRLGGPGRAWRVSPDSCGRLLSEVAEERRSIQAFVGSRGCLQIFSGEVARVQRTGAWFHILDPAVDLHLREGLVAETWVVRKPTRAGYVTSLELYDAAGESIAMFFGQRDPRTGEEPEAWRHLLFALPEARS